MHGVLPWAIAIYRSRRYGDDDLAAAPRPSWWPDTIETQQPGPGAPGDTNVSA